jgi:excisionase family DNA binding protein
MSRLSALSATGKLIPLTEAADIYGLSTKTIRRYISDGRLKAYRVGPRAIRVDRDSLASLLTPMRGGVE